MWEVITSKLARGCEQAMLSRLVVCVRIHGTSYRTSACVLPRPASAHCFHTVLLLARPFHTTFARRFPKLSDERLARVTDLRDQIAAAEDRDELYRLREALRREREDAMAEDERERLARQGGGVGSAAMDSARSRSSHDSDERDERDERDGGDANATRDDDAAGRSSLGGRAGRKGGGKAGRSKGKGAGAASRKQTGRRAGEGQDPRGRDGDDGDVGSGLTERGRGVGDSAPASAQAGSDSSDDGGGI
jgi:hypothetical protein